MTIAIGQNQERGLFDLVDDWLKKDRYATNTDYARMELVVSPMFEALFDTNVIWKSKYLDIFQLEEF